MRPAWKCPLYKVELWVVSHLEVAQETFVRPWVLIFGMENLVTIIITPESKTFYNSMRESSESSLAFNKIVI